MTTTAHSEFLACYEAIHEPFVRYCSSRAYGLVETEDLVQEAILATLQAFSKIRKKEKLLSFMIGTVNNLLKNKWRRKKFRAQWDEALLEKLESQTPSPEALLLFEISGFSIQEVAEIQGSSTAAVKTRLHRSRQKLRKLLSEQGSEKTVSARLAAFATILF